MGAAVFAFLGLKSVEFLEKRLRVKPDSALCFVLASFFGLGVLMASHFQQIAPLSYKQTLLFLYGQAATMTSIHVTIYACCTALIIGFILYFYRYLEMVIFDPTFAKSLGIHPKKIDQLLCFLTVLAVVVGIRCVGVVLMTGMLIAPAIAARPLTNKLSWYFTFAAIFGVLSGFFGNYLSIAVPGGKYSLPTGPMILLTASMLCLLSLSLSPGNGFLIRYSRIRRFRLQCLIENTLKQVWREENREVFIPKKILKKMERRGWIDTAGSLTSKGKAAAEKIIRLHRLWEVYLVDYLGQKAEKVHRTAEELEHLISPDLEKNLTELLKNPRHDPHHQIIPPLKSHSENPSEESI